MQLKPSRRLYNIEVVFPNHITRIVKVKAVSREKAEARALKFHANAIGVKRDSA